MARSLPVRCMPAGISLRRDANYRQRHSQRPQLDVRRTVRLRTDRRCEHDRRQSFITNGAHTAFLEMDGGTFNMSGGTLLADKLVVTNCAHFVHSGGTLTYGSLVLDPTGDADGDGLPNGWEQTHNLDPFSNIGNDGASGDPDGDGFTNLQEYLNGTDPHVSDAPLRITSILRQGNNVLLTWATIAGKTNVVQFTKGTAGGSYSNNFTDLSPVIIPTGSATNYLDVGGATNTPSRFYRVRLVP